ncbi:MAG: hypothetical protein Q9162_007845, partial [Coniocarpon cinnabarinum]
MPSQTPQYPSSSPRLSRTPTRNPRSPQIAQRTDMDGDESQPTSRSSSVFSSMSSLSSSTTTTKATTTTTVTTTTRETVETTTSSDSDKPNQRLRLVEDAGSLRSAQHTYVDASTQTDRVNEANAVPENSSSSTHSNSNVAARKANQIDKATQTEDLYDSDGSKQSHKTQVEEPSPQNDVRTQVDASTQTEGSSQSIDPDAPSDKQEPNAATSSDENPQDDSLAAFEADSTHYAFDTASQLPPLVLKGKKEPHHYRNAYNKYRSLLSEILHPAPPSPFLDLSDAGSFTWRQIMHLIRDDVQHKMRLPSRSRSCDHFAFTRKKDERTFVKVMSYPDLEPAGSGYEFEHLPLCQHFDRDELVRVAACFTAYARGRLEEFGRNGSAERSPSIRSKILRCGVCPSEYRLGVSYRQLSLQYTESPVQGKWQPRFEWIDKPEELHFLFERWINLGLFNSAEEKEWNGLKTARAKRSKRK